MVPDILDTMDAHEGAMFFILGAHQTFKSLIGQLRLLRNHYVRSAPAGWYSPTREFSADFAENKLNLLRDAIPCITDITFADPAKTAKLRAQFTGGASHRLLSFATEPDRHGKTLRDLYIDEAHLLDPDALGQIRNRRGAYPDEFTETLMSTGLIAGTDAALEYARTDQRSWHLRCPACKKFFETRYLHREREDDPASPIIGGLRYTKAYRPDGLPDEAALATTLHHECPRCHDKLPDTHGSRVLLSGTAEKPRGLYVMKNANPAPSCYGWHVNGVALRPWLKMAVRFETAQLARARGDLKGLNECVREEFADIFDPEKYIRPEKFARYPHTGPALDTEGKPNPTPYKMLEDWPGELRDEKTKEPIARFAQIDVQQDWYRLVIRKWGRWSQSRLHYTARCLSATEIALHLAEAHVPPEHVDCDVRYDKQRVRAMCARMRWNTMMGDGGMKDYAHPDGLRRIFDIAKFMDAFSGQQLQAQTAGGYVVETLFSKSSALDRLALLRSPDSKAPDGTPLWTAASDAPDWYFKEINAHYTKRKELANGSYVLEWHGQKEDHSDDCEAMGVIRASIQSLTGAESLPAPGDLPPSKSP